MSPIIYGGSSGGGSSVFTQASATLTNAQIKALPTTGVQVVAAPGPGKVVLVVAALLVGDTTAGAYSNVNASVELGLTPDAAFSGLLVTPIFTGVSSLLTAGLKAVATMGIATLKSEVGLPYVVGLSDGLPTSVFADMPVLLMADNNNAGNFTGGNAANSLTVTAYYATITL